MFTVVYVHIAMRFAIYCATMLHFGLLAQMTVCEPVDAPRWMMTKSALFSDSKMLCNCLF